MRTPVETRQAFDTSRRAALRRLVVTTVARAGFALDPLDDSASFVGDDSTHIPEMLTRFAGIPGMLPLKRCLHLYLLAFGGVRGDVIEIGSWQGRATAFLAQACADTRNGRVHAIDTFQGNPGHEHHYAVDGRLDTLEENFHRNLRQAGLADRVSVYPMHSAEAAPRVHDASEGARLLFLDGEHTYAAVRQDLENYADLVLPGGVIVFDDYAPRFDGDVRAVREHLAQHGDRYGRPFQQRNTLVVPRIA